MTASHITSLLALLLCSCQPSSSEEDGGVGRQPGADPVLRRENVSGSRLKAKFVTGADGSKFYGGLYDSQLMMDCGFQIAPDGKTRCIPAGAYAFAPYFIDDKCTQPLFWVPICQPVMARYAIVYKNGTCGDIGEIRLALPIAPTAAYAKTTTSACMKYDLAYPDARFYSLGDAVSPSMFVEGTPGLD